VGGGNFAARWTGRIDPPIGGTYRLTTLSDDGVRLWLDGKLLIENWTDHGPAEDHATVELTPGRPVELKLEYYQGGGGSRARLSWTWPDGTTEVIPAVRLRQPDGSGPGLRAEYFEGRTLDVPEEVRTDPTIDFEWPPAPRPIGRKVAGGMVEIGLDLPAGRYRVEWVDPTTGRTLKGEDVEHAGGRKSLTTPAFGEDAALAIRAR
jgi:hypothetical protein